MPITAEECRAKAAECDSRAAVAKRFEMKVQHRELAQHWRSMADQMEWIASREVGDKSGDERHAAQASAA
jgi:hypothetical protein